MKKICLLILLLIVSRIQGQDAMIRFADGRVRLSESVILIPGGAPGTIVLAASQLQSYIFRITGIRPAILEGVPSDRRGTFILDFLTDPDGHRGKDDPAPDGFRVVIHRQVVHITGGNPEGALFGVYSLLERYCGCRFWAPGAETVPVSKEISLPDTEYTDNPAFRSREVYYAGMDEEDFTQKMRCNTHAWKRRGDWGLWVHTMFTLVPPDKYFDAHPEYFALMAGKRAKTQLCLTNPDVLKITTAALEALMEEKPEAHYWSVSQMDTYGHCECDACRAIDEREGSPSGSLISFINKVAAAFPGKVISTLAYQYTRKPPRHLKPAPNVNIMLCTIECDRSRPLASDTSQGAFLEDLQGWSAVSGNILVWDYVIQFTNMIAPFPNLAVLRPNIDLFRRYHVDAVFEQGCHGTYSENQELRQYLLAKWLWNPDLNSDSLINGFLDGYFGAAGTYIKHYISRMEKRLQQSGKPLLIYGGPMQETASFLGPGDMDAYDSLFALARKAVADDSLLTTRVEKACLPVMYARIECSKRYITGPDGFIQTNRAVAEPTPEMVRLVDDFVRKATLYGVRTVHERSLPPEIYGQQTLDYFAQAFTLHLAKGRDYSLAVQPAEKYNAEGTGSLTDGKRGSTNYFVTWQGFEEYDLTAVVDLTDQTLINYVGAGFLQDIASWIFYPEKLEVGISSDGVNYTRVALFDSLSFTDPVMVRETGRIIPAVRARYVKFEARNVGRCPGWHIGHGGKAWLFTDELVVDYRP